ncbi:unnamed protein product [Chrysoparadoxa australica]
MAYGKILGLFLILLLGHTAKASEDIYLATITTDYINKSYDLMITLNDRFLIEAIKTKNNQKNRIKNYPVSVLGKPITLVKAVGVTLVSLSCTNFATSRGCDITIEYPANIAVGSFKNFHAKLEKVDGKWQLSHQGKKFTKLHLVARKALGLLIGIKRIEPR